MNALIMCYEVHDIGEPLILLQGGVGAIEMFDEALSPLAEGRQVDAIDLQTLWAHGRHRPPAELRVHGRRRRHPHRSPRLEKADFIRYSLSGVAFTKCHLTPRSCAQARGQPAQLICPCR